MRFEIFKPIHNTEILLYKCFAVNKTQAIKKFKSEVENIPEGWKLKSYTNCKRCSKEIPYIGRSYCSKHNK